MSNHENESNAEAMVEQFVQAEYVAGVRILRFIDTLGVRDDAHDLLSELLRSRVPTLG